MHYWRASGWCTVIVNAKYTETPQPMQDALMCAHKGGITHEYMDMVALCISHHILSYQAEG